MMDKVLTVSNISMVKNVVVVIDVATMMETQ